MSKKRFYNRILCKKYIYAYYAKNAFYPGYVKKKKTFFQVIYWPYKALRRRIYIRTILAILFHNFKLALAKNECVNGYRGVTDYLFPAGP